MNICLNNKIFNLISEIADKKNINVFVIGGFVRDCLLKRASKDIDIVVIGDGISFAREVARQIDKNLQVSVFKNFGTAMFQYQDMEIEFVGARKESYSRNSRKPVVQSGSLEDDQLRRDFTINALAFNLNKGQFGNLVDPFNGCEDLENKIIRAPCDPDKTFSDDPLRMIRGIRFAAQLGFTIETNTYKGIINNNERIRIISMERISDELNKILVSRKPSIGFRLLDECGLLSHILPELSRLKGVESREGKKHKDNFYHTLEVLDNISLTTSSLWLRWAALLHDIGKPATKRFEPEAGWTFHGHDHLGGKMVPGIFKKLRLPLNEKMQYVKKLVVMHLRPISLVNEQVTDSAVRRLLFDAGDDIDDLMTLCEADITSKKEEKKARYLKNFRLVRKKLKEIEEKDAVRNFQPPVSGTEIIEHFGIGPSKNVGIIKNAIKEAILDGIIKNNHEQAWQYMLKIGEELGLKGKDYHK